MPCLVLLTNMRRKQVLSVELPQCIVPSGSSTMGEWVGEEWCCRRDVAERGPLVASEEELEVLGSQGLHGSVVRVDRRVDHIRLLLLEENHAAFDRVLDTETCDDARTRLANAMATIGRLPLSSRVPPPVIHLSVRTPNHYGHGSMHIRIDNEDARGLGQVEGNASSLE